jgi:hypothetical protein
MNESNTSNELTKQQLEERKELFRYADLSHPLINLLFEWQPRPEEPKL